METQQVGAQISGLVESIINMDNRVGYVVLAVIIILALGIAKKAFKTAVSIIILSLVLMAGFWVKGSIVDANDIKVENNRLIVNEQSFNIDEITGFDVDESKSSLVVHLEKGDVNVKIDSNIEGVRKLFEFIKK